MKSVLLRITATFDDLLYLDVLSCCLILTEVDTLLDNTVALCKVFIWLTTCSCNIEEQLNQRYSQILSSVFDVDVYSELIIVKLVFKFFRGTSTHITYFLVVIWLYSS